MQPKSYDYQMKHVERDLVSGAFRGGLLGLCYGVVMGAYMTYSPELSSKQFMGRWSKFTIKSTATFVPVLGVSSVTYKYCQSQAMSEFNSMVVTIFVTGIMFELGKKFIH